MPKRSFIDTNIFIYSVDTADQSKQEIALDLLARHAKDRTGVISTQVLQEFYSAATRKLGIAPHHARQNLLDLRIFDIVQITPELIDQGVECSIRNTLSFWDGLIVASAAGANCADLISEDLSAGQIIDGIVVRNPFP